MQNNKSSLSAASGLRALLTVMAALAGLLSSSASAQLPIHQFRQSETAVDDFAISRPNDIGNLQVNAHLHLDYANDPLVAEAMQGDAGTETFRVVEHNVVAQLGLSLGLFDRLVLFAGLPIHLVQDGEDAASAVGLPADGGGLGDIYFGARVRVFGENDDTFSLALQLSGTANTSKSSAFGERPATGARYSGDNGLTIHPEVLAELRFDALRIGINLGFRIREDADVLPTGISRIPYGDELTFGVGAAYQVWQGDNPANNIDIIAQVYGATAVTEFFGREQTPLEAIVGARYHHPSGFNAGIAGGPGLLRGYGSPDFRVIGMVGYAMPAPSEPTPTDKDGDGIDDADDACPDQPEDMDGDADEDGCPDIEGDKDGDGIMDDTDQCPDAAEDKDGFEDENGCPDEDNDGDGIKDADDQCKDEAEDKDGFEDENGCPDLDNDGDGIPDATDKCKDEAEDKDNIQDEDGCPETDADGDTILDPDDHCPLTAGIPNKKNPECSGCPARACVDNTGTIVILERVEFATNKDKILPSSNPVLEDVWSILKSNTQIKSIRVEGHTDDKGKVELNMDLAKRRAASVRKWLLARGEIDASRLHAYGCGPHIPFVKNSSKKNRQKNRRVEFHITEPAPAEALTRENEDKCVIADDVQPKD